MQMNHGGGYLLSGIVVRDDGKEQQGGQAANGGAGSSRAQKGQGAGRAQKGPGGGQAGRKRKA